MEIHKMDRELLKHLKNNYLLYKRLSCLYKRIGPLIVNNEYKSSRIS